MGFLHPIYFLLSFILLLVILLYFFRKQYEEKTIPSVLLWKEWMYEYEAQAWWKKLQHHILLYLQLFILLMLIFALVKPFFETKGIEGDHVIFIFDTSATMGTMEDESKTRLDLAKQQALLLLQQTNGQKISVMEAKETPVIYTENTMREWQKLIEELEISYATSHVTNSIILAQGLLGDNAGQIYVFSDSYEEDKSLPPFRDDTSLHVINIGEVKDNLSLMTFGVAKRQDEVIGIATIFNEADQEKEVDLVIYGDGEKVSEQRVKIGANEQNTVSLQQLPSATYYEAVITGDEAYTTDNSQFAFLLDGEASTTYLHSGIHPFVTKAVEIVGGNFVHVADHAIETSAGVHVMKANSEGDYPAGPKLVFGSNNTKVNVSGATKTSEQHPIVHLVDMQDVYIENAYERGVPGLETLVEAEGTPLIQAGIHEGYPTVFLAFDLEDSDWPLHPSFPLFIYNSLQYLVETNTLIGYFTPGEQLTYDASPRLKKLEFIRDSEVVEISNWDQVISLPTEPGFYTFRETYDNNTVEEKYVYVLLEEGEKTISPATSFSIGMDSIEREEGVVLKDISFLFLLLAFIVLLIEWEVYRRAVSS